MPSILIAFFSSLFTTLLIMRFKHLHQSYSSDWDFSGPQKFHNQAVPRIGGISIVIGIFSAILIRLKNLPMPNIEIYLLMSAAPTFAIGLTEDLTKKISVRLRLLFTSASAAIFIHLLQAKIISLGLPLIDLLFSIPFFATFITIFAITGLANAYNIIDGFNGLASMVAIITLLAIAYVSYVVSDALLVSMSLFMAASILGFFIWNYPKGLIFLGDGGAYLIGFWIATLSILLTSRHTEISPWFALLINGYPIIETLFTIYRRGVRQGKSPGQPDGMHIHTLIYRRVLSPYHRSENLFSANARTSPYLWILAGLCILPALIWWQSTSILMLASFIFIAFYTWIYRNIVCFKTPRWLLLDN